MADTAEIELTVLELMRRARARTDLDIEGAEGLVAAAAAAHADRAGAARHVAAYLLTAVRMGAFLAQQTEPVYPGDLWGDLERIIRERHQEGRL